MIYLYKCSVCDLEFDLDLETPKDIVSCPNCQEKATRKYQINVKKHEVMK